MANAPMTKYFMAPSAERRDLRCEPVRTYTASDMVSMPRNTVTRSDAMTRRIIPDVANRTSG